MTEPGTSEPTKEPAGRGANSIGPGRILLIVFVGLILLSGSFYAVAFTLPDDALPGYGKDGKPKATQAAAPDDADTVAPSGEIKTAAP